MLWSMADINVTMSTSRKNWKFPNCWFYLELYASKKLHPTHTSNWDKFGQNQLQNPQAKGSITDMVVAGRPLNGHFNIWRSNAAPLHAWSSNQCNAEQIEILGLHLGPDEVFHDQPHIVLRGPSHWLLSSAMEATPFCLWCSSLDFLNLPSFRIEHLGYLSAKELTHADHLPKPSWKNLRAPVQ